MIDKSIRQYYSRGQLVKPGPGRPGYQGPAGGSHGSYGGSSSPSRGGGGGGGGRDRHPPAPRPAPRPYTPAPKPAPTPYAEPDPVTEVVSGDKTFEPVEKYLSNIGPSLHGGPTYDQDKVDITKMIREQALEKLDVIPDDTTQLDLNKFGETYEPVKPDLRTEKETEEDWERAQDWDLIKDMSKKGYDFDEIQGAVERGLTAKAGPRLRSNLIESGLRSLRNVVPETGLEKSLLGRAKSLMPGAKEGIMSGLGGLSKFLNPGKMITNFALSKMGLGFLNPIMGIASLFGFNPFKNMGTKYAGVPYKKKPTIREGDGGPEKDVIQAGIQKFQPTDQQTAQMDEIRRKMMILQGHADKGALNERGQNTLMQLSQLVKQYQVNPRSIYG